MGWAEAVQRVTSVPAARLGIKDRGLLKAGLAADIVVFDPVRIEDPENYADSAQEPTGISYVLVDGKLAKTDQGATGACGGKIVLRN